QALADGVHRAAEAPLPDAVRENDDLRPRLALLARLVGSTDERRHAHDLEVVGARTHSLYALGLVAPRQVGVEGEDRRDRLQDPDLISVIVDVDRRERHAAIAKDILNRDELTRVAIRQWPKQHIVDDAEDRGVGADAERQGEDGN